jgi:hypothetical protein
LLTLQAVIEIAHSLFDCLRDFSLERLASSVKYFGKSTINVVSNRLEEVIVLVCFTCALGLPVSVMADEGAMS